MEIRLFNTLTQKKETFFPQEGKIVRFYVCGPTVYDLIHIGNARVFVVFDSLRRFLEYSGGWEVIMVQNFTDIDDKIIKRAEELGESPEELAERYITEYWHDAENLKIRKATYHPRATEHIEDIIALIRTLEEKGYTYEKEGDILFDVSRFPSYGKLSRKNLDELVEGARVEARYEKKNPADFVLWKRAKPDEPSWESPWGRGRPGWHIECSAMAMKYLGSTLDIHAGGIDLIFPHHENEIAQSEAATGKPFARFFLHNGYVNINREKMSKSLGNIVTVRELTQKYSPSVLRLAIFSAHYRSPINLDENLLQSSCQFEERIKNFLRNIGFIEEKVKDNPPLWKEDKEEYRKIDEFYQSFQEALADDFNTPQALGVLGEFLRLFNQYLAPYRGKWDLQVLEKMRDFLKAVEEILGIIPEEEMKEEDEIIIKLVEEREGARKNRDWERGDRLREEIRSRGYIVEDTPLGPRFFKMEE
mgnify:FL=1